MSSAAASASVCFCVTVLCCSICCLCAVSAPPPSFSSLTQPPLANVSSASLATLVPFPSPQIRLRRKCASPLNRWLLCPISSSSWAPQPPSTKYPFAGWAVTSPPSPSPSVTSVAEGRIENQKNSCFDRSAKCADFANLCSDTLYNFFLHSHCALTCGFCGNGTVSRRGIGGGVRAPTKSWSIGGRDGRGNGQTEDTSAKTPQKVIKPTEQIVTTTELTTKSTETEENWKKVDTAENGQSTEEEKCADEGKNCAAMERMCGGSFAQKDIMDTFCRKTCKLC